MLNRWYFVICCWLCTTTCFAQVNVTRIMRVAAEPNQTVIEVLGTGLGNEPRLYRVDSQVSPPLPLTADPANKQRFTFTKTAADPHWRLLEQFYIEGEHGIAGPFLVPIDHLDPYVYAPDLKLTKPLAGIMGTLTGDQQHSVTFAGEKGQELTIRIQAKRWGSKLNPVLKLNDQRGVQLAWAQGSRRYDGDAEMRFTLPYTGEYSLLWHDALYRGAAPGNYRIELTHLPQPEFFYPEHVSKETPVFALFPHRVEQWKEAGQSFSDHEWQVKTSTLLATKQIPLNYNTSNLERICPFASEAQNWETPNWKIDAFGDLTKATAWVGIIAKPGEEDRWPMTIPANTTWRFTVFAKAFDPVLTIYDKEGKQLKTSDDQKNSLNPMIEHASGKEPLKIQLGIKDLLGRGAWDLSYDVSANDLNQPSVGGEIHSDKLYVMLDARQISKQTITRKNVNDQLLVKTTINPVPFELNSDDQEFLYDFSNINVNESDFLIHNFFDINSAKQPEQTFQGIHKIANLDNQRRPGLPVIYTSRPTPIAVDIAPELSKVKLPLGGTVKLPVKLTRLKPNNGPVRIKLMTNQPLPKKPGKENNQVEDTSQGIRLASDVVIASDKDTAEVTLMIPDGLKNPSYQLALEAELLSTDQKQVLASSWTTIITGEPIPQLQVQLNDAQSNAKSLPVRAGTGDTTTLTGKIIRAEGFTGPVRVTLTGWPSEFPAPIADVAADQAEFSLPLRLPRSVKAGPLKNVQLIAHSQPRAGYIMNPLRSPGVALSLDVVAGEKPADWQPLLLFDEQRDFPQLLTIGKAEAKLDDKNIYRGKVALSVFPDQRSATNIPGWSYKIRANPGPGEYRYVTYAWSFQGGKSLALQFAAAGKFGPPKKGELGYRYQAGQGKLLDGAISLSDNFPARKYQVVTRDLYADFGEFTLTGLGLVLIDNQVGYLDQLYLGRTLDDVVLEMP